MRQLQRSTLLSVILMFMFTIQAPAKSKVSEGGLSPLKQSMISPDRHQLTQLELRLTPFLKNRLIRRGTVQSKLQKVDSFDESDFKFIAQNWSNLSPQFIALFKQATTISDLFSVYITPGGHFEIYYTPRIPATKDVKTASFRDSNGVDTADHYGYSTTTWNQRTSEKNGIPDYIDEVAFALDSCWSMQINRFGMIPPIPFKDANHSSERYKVVIEAQEPSFYGVTLLFERPADDTLGFPSYISMRNNWNLREWSHLGYDVHPKNGARVTCAHEFFHSIHYAMSWNVESSVLLDNFPLSWTEGAATSMEEMMFDSINDFHQYASFYFSNPEMSFFDEAYNEMVYSNSILFLYIYQNLSKGFQNISFTRSMLFANYEKRSLSFSDNLFSAADSLGTDWPTIMHQYHLNSFYTGIYADSTKFIHDAKAFSLYVPTSETIDTTYKTIRPNSAVFFRMLRAASHRDTVEIVATTDSFADSTQPALPTRCSVRLFKVLNESETRDSIISMPLSSGSASLFITGWQEWDELTVIMTNGSPKQKQKCSVYVQPFAVTYRKGAVVKDSLVVKPSGNKAVLALTALDNLQQDFSLSLDNTIPAAAATEDFIPISKCFNVMYPNYWRGKSELLLTISAPVESVGDSTDEMVYFTRWNGSHRSWTVLDSSVYSLSDHLTFTHRLESGGSFALVKKQSKTSPTDRSITIYPNPLSQRKHNGILKIRGNELNRMDVYTAGGSLVYKEQFTDEHSSADTGMAIRIWQLPRAGKAFSQGLYYILLEQTRRSTGEKQIHRKKLLITP